MKSTLIDAGPMVALFDKHDIFHQRVLEFTRQYTGRFLTTWPVITETSYMLRFSAQVQVDFLTWLYRGAVRVIELEHKYLGRMITLFKKYADLPMDLADGSLLVASEITGVGDIVTIDSDYDIYRLHDGRGMRNILEPYLETDG